VVERRTLTVVIVVAWAVAMFASRFFDPLMTVFVAAAIVTPLVMWRERANLFRVTPRIAVLSAAATLAMLAVTYIVFAPLLHRLPLLANAAHVIYARFLGHHHIAVVIAIVVPVVFAEEVLWRGYVQRPPGLWSALGAATLYALAHAPAGSVLLVAVAFVCGLFWSLLRDVSGSLVPSLCAHLVWDVALMLFPLIAIAR
jgi:membrane protease YdiL (CAAX protease family)